MAKKNAPTPQPSPKLGAALNRVLLEQRRWSRPRGWQLRAGLMTRAVRFSAKGSPLIKMTTDGTLYYEHTSGRSVGVLLQSEASTQSNISALVGKASLARPSRRGCRERLVGHESATSKRLVELTPDEVHVVFLSAAPGMRERVEAIQNLLVRNASHIHLVITTPASLRADLLAKLHSILR